MIPRSRPRPALPAAACAVFLAAGAPAATAQEEAAGTAAREVTVEAGDTLWDLAARLMGTPLRWRALYEANRDRLSSPHRLRPGLVLRVPAEAAPERTGAPAASRRLRAAGGVGRGGAGSSGRDSLPEVRLHESLFGPGGAAARGLGRFRVQEAPAGPRVSASAVLAAPFLATEGWRRRAGRTVGTLADAGSGAFLPVSLAGSAPVRIRFPGPPPAVGDRLQAVRARSPVREFGEVLRPVAVLRVTEVEGRAAAAAVETRLGLLQSGDPVLPAPPLPPRDTAEVAVANGLRVRVLTRGSGREILGLGGTVFLAAGEASGVRVGDDFAVFDAPADAAGGGARPSFHARVVRVERRTATAVVTDLERPSIRDGAVAVLVARGASSGGG